MSYNQLECDYFNLYNQFSKIDTKISLIYGRNRELIKDFMLFYRQIIKQEKSIENLKEQRNKIAIKLNNYMKKFNASPDHLNYSCLFYKEHLNAFNVFYKAIAYYITFKQKLSNIQKKQLANDNIVSRLNYYYEIEGIDNFVKNIEKELIINNKYTISKYALNEFNNAMTHLCVIYLNINDKIIVENNINSAIKHLKLGALYSYKFIIKDYFTLYKNDTSLIRKILKLRDYEYVNIGNKKELIENYIFENYKDICSEIINKLGK